MSEEEIRSMIEYVLEDYLVSDQVISGTLSEMGLDSMDFCELLIEFEGELEDNGFKVNLDGEFTLDNTIEDIVSIIHKLL